MYVFTYFLIVLFIGFVWLLGNLDLLWVSENRNNISEVHQQFMPNLLCSYSF